MEQVNELINELNQLTDAVLPNGEEGYFISAGLRLDLIETLSRPVPFDVLKAVATCKPIQNEDGHVYEPHFIDNQWVYENSTTGKPMNAYLLGRYKKWQPYKEPELADGLYHTTGGSVAELVTGATKGKRVWLRIGNDKPFDFEDVTPLTNPATGKPWRIEEPEV